MKHLLHIRSLLDLFWYPFSMLTAICFQYSPDDEEDTDKLRQLFKVTQSVMSVKAAQADIALEEVEKTAASAGKADATRGKSGFSCKAL